MPVFFTTDDPVAYGLWILWGRCDNCGDGSEASFTHAMTLYCQDRDGIGPMLCATCFRGMHDEEPTLDDVADVGDPSYFQNYPHFADTLAARSHFDGSAVTPTIQEEVMPRATSDVSNLRADRVVETYGFDTDYQPHVPRLLLPVLPDREPRLISVEQEIGKGGETVAARFYDGGFALNSYMLGYHSSGRTTGAEGFCHVEEDASVNAEIIYGKLRLSDPGVAARFEDALCVVRKAIQDDEVKLDMRCGLHVHVDGMGLGMNAVENLYHLWNHLEDTVYRLAAANWRCHRTSVASTNYAPPTMKGLATRGEIGRHFETERGALNLSNYLAARGRCRCGAFAFASWEDCTCDLPKPTIEFRVFNATANLRKIHAYTALSLAMVEASRRLTVNPDDFPAFHFNPRNVEVTDTAATEKALRLIFETLPLTDTEREDLAYCARSSAVSEVYGSMYEVASV